MEATDVHNLCPWLVKSQGWSFSNDNPATIKQSKWGNYFATNCIWKVQYNEKTVQQKLMIDRKNGWHMHKNCLSVQVKKFQM